MRIAMVVRSFSENGGLELYTYQLVNGLLNRGHDLTVVCENDDSGLEHPRLRVQKFAASPKGARKSQRIVHLFEAASQAVAQCGPFEIVHSQHLPMRGANVVTFHNHTATRLTRVGYEWERMLTRAKMTFVPAYKLRDSFDLDLCKTADSLVFPSAVCRDDFVETYKVRSINPRCSLVVAYPGAALATAAESEIGAAKSPADPITFLFVGKGFRKKGLDVLLQSCVLLKRQGRKFRLLIAGLKEKPIDAARNSLLGLKDNVKYLGFCKEMGKVYARATAVVLPSRIEPFGMAPLQGALHGCVPIVSRVCGAAEVIEHDVSGLVLENHLDAAELARHLSRLMDDPALATRLAQSASLHAAKLTWERTVDSTLQAYEAALSILKS